MPLLEQDVGHVTAARIDQETPHLPDLTIEGIDVITGTHLCLTDRDDLVDDDPLGAVSPCRS